ncbi:extracellular solute-binding protein [Paenibacillus psychroresistens]|uniref:Extracellular solute-binding protein n=1 Tax=Paenibacillus psychroresistens TaxID=1778678 RepID=A0A6B8RSC0_9BACL|nr:extracellular solute-binding protein [Paenibacillus psychroresistens]QGQ99331.1 extracellular solute-binding protein [Paenibacillus psychroresistens]
MKIKKMVVIIIILLIAFTSSACNKVKEATEPVEIHFLVDVPKSLVPLGPDATFYTDAVENFHTINPLITVILDYLPESIIKRTEQGTFFSFLPDDTEKLLESKESPDILGISLADLSVIDKKGLLFDLLKISGSEKIDINKQILGLATRDGKLLTIPFAAHSSAILFNKELFDAANTPYPQGNWTWEQFREISKVVNPTKGPLLNYTIDTLDLLLGSLEKGLLSPDKTTSVGYLDSPEAVRTIQWLNAYYHDSGQITPINGGIFPQFDGHQIGMILGGMGTTFSTFMGDNASKLGVAPLPHFADGKRANPTSFIGFGISQNSKHPQEAWEFIKYLTLSKNADSIKFAGRTLATSKLMAEAVGQNSDPVKSVYVGELSYATISTDYSFFKTWNEDKDLTEQFEKLLTTKDEDIPAKLHELALKIDQALKKANSVSDDQQTNNTNIPVKDDK